VAPRATTSIPSSPRKWFRNCSTGVALVGVDTLTVDDHRDPERPAHSRLLAEEVLIAENLANLDAVVGERFSFFAVALKASGAVALPVRAFAQLA
jgi:kynurenine formamidase